MKTQYLNIEDPGALEEAVRLLLLGEVLAFPTETVYGLGICYNQGFEKLCNIKKRSPSKTITICLDSYKNVNKLTKYIPESFWKLGRSFFPGPLTIVFSSGEETVGIRVPEHKFCQQLIKKTGPLYVTSANYSNYKDLTDSTEVYQAFKGQISGVIADSKRLKFNIPSTVIQIHNGGVQLLREGPISWNLIRESL